MATTLCLKMANRRNKICSLCIVVLLVNGCSSTFDLSDQEVIRLASELSDDECAKLYATLHYHHLSLDKFKGMQVPDLPCQELLRKWNDFESENRSFQLLDLRLTQLGHKDLADELSSKVFDEQAEQLKNAFRTVTESAPAPRENEDSVKD
jgi:hypothetical protein